MMVVKPHLDCIAQGRLGNVRILLGGEGVEALAGDGVELVKARLACLGDAQAGAACSGLRIPSAHLSMGGPKLQSRA